MKKISFPKELFITKEGDGSDAYFSAGESNRGIEDGAVVAIYQLVTIKKQQVTEKLV